MQTKQLTSGVRNDQLSCALGQCLCSWTVLVLKICALTQIMCLCSRAVLVLKFCACAQRLCSGCARAQIALKIWNWMPFERENSIWAQAQTLSTSTILEHKHSIWVQAQIFECEHCLWAQAQSMSTSTELSTSTSWVLALIGALKFWGALSLALTSTSTSTNAKCALSGALDKTASFICFVS